MEYPFILGTAGHIDHGKTALVRALTGVDCDRLNEEKKRGITIELGFAPFELPSGRVVSIIDVPGHERFIRQMVAGAAGIDAAMLVVAADEGVMPQTREHLDILKLLGVSRGVVALSKCDLVSDELLMLARSDVEELVKDTFLEKSPVIPLSAVTGDGMDDLRREIERLVDASPCRDAAGAFFMPIDRAFTMRGFGSVVTGTAYQGALSEGEGVSVIPSMLGSKVRSIQIHGAPEKKVVAGQRTALNLSSVSVEQLHRGDAVCAEGRFAPTDCLDVSMEMLKGASEPLTHWQRVRLHIGTADVVARVSLLANRGGFDSALKPGERGVAQLITETPVGVAAGQRFIVRFYSPLVTIGGGHVLMTDAPRAQNRGEREERQRILGDLAENWSRTKLLEAMVRVRGCVAEQKLYEHSQMDRESFDASLAELKKKRKSEVEVFGRSKNIFISKRALSAATDFLTGTLATFHREHNELSGLEADELRTAMANEHGVPEIGQKEFKDLLDLLVSRDCLEASGTAGEVKYRVKGFKPGGDKKFTNLVRDLSALAEEAGFELIEMSETTSRLGASPAEIARAVSFLRENEDLRIVGSNMIFPAATRKKAHDVLLGIDGDITLASFRDAIGTSRKYALAILEFFDSNDVTRRVGDKRVLLRQSPQK